MERNVGRGVKGPHDRLSHECRDASEKQPEDRCKQHADREVTARAALVEGAQFLGEQNACTRPDENLEEGD